jgi:hypothetical protein
MTSRERWLALLAGRPPDRIPCDYWGTEEVTQRLLVELGCASELELWERLSIDKLVHIGPTLPPAKEDMWHIQSQYSVWHIGTAKVPYGNGLGVYEEAVTHPLAQPTLWPMSSNSTGQIMPCGISVESVRSVKRGAPILLLEGVTSLSIFIAGFGV